MPNDSSAADLAETWFIVEPGAPGERNRLGGYGMNTSQCGGIMRIQQRNAIALVLVIIGCQRGSSRSTEDTTRAQVTADSPAAAAETTPKGEGATPPVKSTSTGTAGITPSEPGTIPATPTPAVTSESSITAMRQSLQQLESASAQELSTRVSDHQKKLGDLLTTMRVEVQAATSTTKDTWLAAADSVEGDLDKLALANGEALRTAFRDHRTRVLRLLDSFRALVPPKSM